MPAVPMAFRSFGSWKNSLFGNHPMYGPEGERFFTRQKMVTTRGQTGMTAGADSLFPTMK